MFLREYKSAVFLLRVVFGPGLGMCQADAGTFLRRGAGAGSTSEPHHSASRCSPSYGWAFIAIPSSRVGSEKISQALHSVLFKVIWENEYNNKEWSGTKEKEKTRPKCIESIINCIQTQGLSFICPSLGSRSKLLPLGMSLLLVMMQLPQTADLTPLDC